MSAQSTMFNSHNFHYLWMVPNLVIPIFSVIYVFIMAIGFIYYQEPAFNTRPWKNLVQQLHYSEISRAPVNDFFLKGHAQLCIAPFLNHVDIGIPPKKSCPYPRFK